MSHPTAPPSNETTKTQQPSQQIGLTFNWEDWLPYFEDETISDAQKREMIETLWQIVIAFVDLGFELNPHQQVGQQSCGQNLDLKSLLERAVLRSDAFGQAKQHARSLPNNPKHKEPTL